MDERQTLDRHIERWREYVLAHGVGQTRVAVLEDELRDHALSLGDAGLDVDETFLVALRRSAAGEEASRDFAREYADGLWTRPAGTEGGQGVAHAAAAGFWVMLGCAVAAALAVKVPTLFGLEFDGPDGGFYARNLSLFVLPFLAIYFVWKRRPGTRAVVALAAVFGAGAVFANAYPFTPGGSTEVLTSIHLPIVLWLAVGVAYVAGDWLNDERRMEYVRFTGEWFITYVLIGLGGGVLVALSIGVFGAIGLNAEPFVEEWILSCAMGAVVVAAWLVETRPGLVGGMAPMLARVFTPLFALMLVALLAGVIWTSGVIDIEREVLILFDLLLVVVVALVLYGISARDPLSGPALFDRVQLLLVVCALAVDVFALVNIAGRLTEFGFSANRTAALGLNLVLLANLVWSALLQAGFLRARRPFEAVERWQMRYLPVYALWASVVVIVFPPLFSFA
jgi:hypothetical protein